MRRNKEVTPYLKVLYWFFDYPTLPISLSELSEKLEISKATAHRIVSELIKEGFLLKEVVGRTWRLTCNLKHFYNISRKIPYHLQLVYESGIIEKILEKFPDALAIVLFGSYRWGDDTHESDLDIAVELPEVEEIRQILLTRINIGFRKKVPVNLFVFSRDKVDLNLFANIANGIVLHGFLEVRP